MKRAPDLYRKVRRARVHAGRDLPIGRLGRWVRRELERHARIAVGRKLAGVRS